MLSTVHRPSSSLPHLRIIVSLKLTLASALRAAMRLDFPAFLRTVYYEEHQVHSLLNHPSLSLGYSPQIVPTFPEPGFQLPIPSITLGRERQYAPSTSTTRLRSGV
jgi:hypothetical protein